MNTEITIAEQIAEIEREMAIRDRVYARWVDKGKITKKAADLQQARMRAARDTLKRAMVELPGRNPGETSTGESFGPAKVREVERAKVLNALRPLIDDRAMYRVIAELQAADAGYNKRT